MVTVEFGFHLTLGWPRLTSCFIQKWPKINSIRQYTKWPKLEFFRIFQKLAFRSKIAHFESQKFAWIQFWNIKRIFIPFYVTLGEMIFSKFLDFLKFLNFEKKFQNNKIIFDRLNFWIIFYWGNYSRISFFSIQECSTNYYGVFKIWRRTNAKFELPFNFFERGIMTSLVWRNLIWRHFYDVIYSESFEFSIFAKIAPNSSLIFAKEI